MQKYDAVSYFNPTAMPDGSYFISEQEIDAYQGTEFAWIKTLPLVDYTTSLPDTTPPTMSGIGVIIPNEYMGVFPGNQFKVNGFIVNLTAYGQQQAVDIAYMNWQNFKDELDREYNYDWKQTLMFIWDYVAVQIANNNTVPLS
jgi:hypothetical protein